MMTTGMYTSKTDVWETPIDFFKKLEQRFSFDVDVCALPENAKVANFYSPDDDGLSQDWSKYNTCWMNPPYGRVISKWIEKAYNESLNGTTVVALVPARVDTRWFHDFIYNKNNTEIEFIKGRLTFGNAKSNAPFPSMLVIFKGVK